MAVANAAGHLNYATRSQIDDLGSGNFRQFDSILSQGIDGDGFIRRREEYRYVEQWIGEEGEFNEETTITFNLWSTVLGAMIAELDEEGDPTTCFVYAGSRIAKFQDDVKFAAFVLLHELGHRRKIYGNDDKDSVDDKNGTGLEKTERNNKKILDACFPP